MLTVVPKPFTRSWIVVVRSIVRSQVVSARQLSDSGL